MHRATHRRGPRARRRPPRRRDRAASRDSWPPSIGAQPPHDDDEAGERGDAEPGEEVEMHAVVELDRVPSRREGKADHAERVGADLHAFAVDRRAPAAVVRLANDETASGIPGLDAPAPKTSG